MCAKSIGVKVSLNLFSFTLQTMSFLIARFGRMEITSTVFTRAIIGYIDEDSTDGRTLIVMISRHAR